jgi:hypothetical protein
LFSDTFLLIFEYGKEEKQLKKHTCRIRSVQKSQLENCRNKIDTPNKQIHVHDGSLSWLGDLWQVGGFLLALWFPPPINLTTMI